MTLFALIRPTNLSEQFYKARNYVNNATSLRPILNIRCILDIRPILDISPTLNTRPTPNVISSIL